MQPQPQTDLTEQPLSAQKHETLGPGVAARPSRSEDSSISCKGLFEAGDGEEGASRDLLATAPGALRPESSSAGNEFGDQEGGLQALKERKDAAARDVKLHIDRWWVPESQPLGICNPKMQAGLTQLDLSLPLKAQKKSGLLCCELSIQNIAILPP